LVWKCKEHFGHVGAPAGDKNMPMPPKGTFKRDLLVACSGYVEEKSVAVKYATRLFNSDGFYPSLTDVTLTGYKI